MALRGSNYREIAGLGGWSGLGGWFQLGKCFGLSRWLLLLTLFLRVAPRPPLLKGNWPLNMWPNGFRSSRAAHRGKAPANEEEFFAFIQKRTATREVAIEREKFLTSPRDNQKYVVNMAKNRPRPPKIALSSWKKRAIRVRNWSPLSQVQSRNGRIRSHIRIGGRKLIESL